MSIRVRPSDGIPRFRTWVTLTVCLLLASCKLLACDRAPIFENVATNWTGKQAAMSLSVSVPPSTIGQPAGDLLIAVLGAKINPAVSGPPGWTVIPQINGFNTAICASDDEGIACNMTAYYKIADGSEQSVQFGFPGGSPIQAAGAVMRYSRVDAASPIGAVGRQPGSSNAPTSPSITTTRADSRVLRLAISEADNVRNSLTNTVLTAEPPFARFNILSFPPASTDLATGCGPPLSGCSYTNEAVGLAASDTVQQSVGATPTLSWSLPGTEQWLGVTIEIKKPADTSVIALDIRGRRP
jgi:hypothetical protein